MGQNRNPTPAKRTDVSSPLTLDFSYFTERLRVLYVSTVSSWRLVLDSSEPFTYSH